MLHIKNTATEMDNATGGSSVGWTQPNKESQSLKIKSQKPPKVKCKEKKE